MCSTTCVTVNVMVVRSLVIVVRSPTVIQQGNYWTTLTGAKMLNAHSVIGGGTTTYEDGSYKKKNIFITK